ncbi:MAG: hypothetical protein IRY99_11125 [Isosphaeraceae bacterium]|nr:hypothetical protein [Isosphaeraceae bacterium]
MRMNSVIRPLCWVAALALVAIAGCGDDAPPIGQVSGTVTRGGKPVPNLTVNFMPTEGRPSWGLTDANGRYTLHWDEAHEGAEVGTHKVSVAFVPGSPEEEAARARGTLRLPAEQQAITEKYGNFETTPLTFEVKKGRQVIDIKLD